MTEVTVEKCETVKNEVTRYECDECGYRGKWSEFSEFHLKKCDDEFYKDEKAESGHLCDSCTDADNYLRYIQIRDTMYNIISWVNITVYPVTTLVMMFFSSLAVGTYLTASSSTFIGAVIVSLIVSALLYIPLGMFVFILSDIYTFISINIIGDPDEE